MGEGERERERRPRGDKKYADTVESVTSCLHSRERARWRLLRDIYIHIYVHIYVRVCTPLVNREAYLKNDKNHPHNPSVFSDMVFTGKKWIIRLKL